MKPIRNNKGNNRPMNNFFIKMIQKYGEDFLEKANSGELANGIPSLFRDLAKGRIDVSKHGHYFLDPRFVNICMIEANSKLQYYIVHTKSLVEFMNNHSANMDANEYQIYQQTLTNDQKSNEAYYIIVCFLDAMQKVWDQNLVFSVVAALRQYRSNI